MRGLSNLAKRSDVRYSCSCASESHPPISTTRMQMHQASLPGIYVILVAPTWPQYGQRTTAGTSLRDESAMGTDCDWLTGSGCVCTLPAICVSPTKSQTEGREMDVILTCPLGVGCVLFRAEVNIYLHTVYTAIVLCVCGWIMAVKEASTDAAVEAVVTELEGFFFLH